MICVNRHCFDFDRKGALNLLPVQFKKSLAPGDSKEMVLARQQFLNSGAYQPIAEKLCHLLKQSAANPAVVLDAGCGEGYYTAFVAQHYPQSAMIGLDISKPAIQAAAFRTAKIQWLVATNKKIPLLDHSLDVIFCLFGFPVWAEFKRVLKPGGIVIMADSGSMHLIELRRVLYPQLTEKIVTDKTTPGFVLKAQENFKQFIAPPKADLLAAQIAMTPHHYRALPENRTAAIAATYDRMTLDVSFSIYQC